jgi:hypothetical protein
MRGSRADLKQSWSIAGRRRTFSLCCCLLLSSCASVGGWFGRDRDAPRCRPLALILRGSGEVHRRYEVIARVGTTCRRAGECDEQLQARACDLDGDAVIVGSATRQGPSAAPPVGFNGEPLGEGKPGEQLTAPTADLAERTRPTSISQSALIVRWLEPGSGAYAARP